MDVDLTPATPGDAPAIASLWHSGWHDAHANLVPESLVALRTPDSFLERARKHVPATTVAKSDERLTGFTMTTGDELFQLYVADEARGTGVAAALMLEAERQFAARDVTTAWLACAIGNDRAARFYEKRGWHLVGTMADELELVDGTFSLDVWRFEKAIA